MRYNVQIENILAAIDCTFDELFIKNEPINILPVKKIDFKRYYQAFLKYNKAIESASKKKILTSIITKAKIDLRNNVLLKEIDFSEEYPELEKTLVSFYDWADKQIQNDTEEDIYGNNLPSINKKVNINQIVKDAFTQRMPYYKYEKKGYFPGVINYSKPWNDSHLLVLIDRGTKRSWIDFYIGFTKPKVSFSLNDLLLIGNIFQYGNFEEAEECIARAVGIVEIYLKYFNKCFTPENQ